MVQKTLLHLICISLFLIPLEGIGASQYILTEAGLMENPQLQKQQEYGGILGGEYTRLSFPTVWKLKPTYDISREISAKLQDYKLSCEIAALEMVLRYLGYTVSEDDIIRELPIYNIPYNTGSGIWGDPDEEFVGYLTGSQRGMTGYGVYAGPLLKVAKKFGFMGVMRDGIREGFDAKKEMTYMIDRLLEGHGVILWGDWCTREEYEDGLILLDESWLRFFPIAGKNICNRSEGNRILYWKTPSGKTIEGISGEHAFVLLGYIGEKNNPTHIIVWDTDTGRHIYPIDEWERKWRLLEYRSLIIQK